MKQDWISENRTTATSRITGISVTATLETNSVSEEKQKREVESALKSFVVMGPDTPHLAKGEAVIQIDGMIRMSQTDDSLHPTVMITLESGDQKISVPMLPHQAVAVGVQFIEAASYAEMDVREIEFDRKAGVPMSESMDRLSKLAALRASVQGDTSSHE